MNLNLGKNLFNKDLDNLRMPSIKSLHNALEKYYSNLERLKDATKFYTIDRFEGDIAVIENRYTQKMSNIDKNLLPNKVKEGSIIKFENNKYILDEKKTNDVNEKISEMFNNLKQ